MTKLTAAEQVATFSTQTFKDGDISDGSPTEEEAAATEANAASTEDDETEEPESAESAEDGERDETTQEALDAAESSEEAPPKKEAGAKPKKAAKSTAAERIGDLTANWRTAQREADMERTKVERLQAELDALKSGAAPLTGAQPAATGGAGGPDPSQFDYGELDPKYIAALARYETGQALKAHAAEEDTTRQAAAADARRQEVVEKSDKLVRAGLNLHDDFDDVVMQGAREGRWELSPTLGELILDSEFGPQIVYDLASDPAESRRVAKLSAAQQAAFFGRQEAKFEATQASRVRAPKTSQAAPPPKIPRGGSGSNTVNADSHDFAAVEKAWRARALH